MAATTLTAVPSAIYAGDTLLFELAGGNYPANESWTLTADFRASEATAITAVASADSDGTSHLFNVAAATTAQWLPAVYRGIIRASNGSHTATIWTGTLEVLSDYAQMESGTDTRSHAQKCLDAIESVLEGKATRDALSTTIAGQSITRMTFDELLRAKTFYQSVVDQENAKDLAGRDMTNHSNVLIRFN